MKLHLLKEKTCKRPTVLGWMLFLLTAGLLLWFSLPLWCAFLCLHEPIAADILVVEGNVPDYALDRAVALDKASPARWIFTTGIPIEHAAYLTGYTNYADLTAALLKIKGVDSNRIISVPCQPVRKDRTFTSALALREKLRGMGIPGGVLNVISSGSHSRRTQLLFKRALGPNWRIGIYSIPDRDYDQQHWWRSSYGMRAVVYEGLAFLYAVIAGSQE
jgi:uncharacterized SAM-binding protein YcdF (DUF218 family)